MQDQAKRRRTSAEFFAGREQSKSDLHLMVDAFATIGEEKEIDPEEAKE